MRRMILMENKRNKSKIQKIKLTLNKKLIPSPLLLEVRRTKIQRKVIIKKIILTKNPNLKIEVSPKLQQQKIKKQPKEGKNLLLKILKAKSQLRRVAVVHWVLRMIPKLILMIYQRRMIKMMMMMIFIPQMKKEEALNQE